MFFVIYCYLIEVHDSLGPSVSVLPPFFCLVGTFAA